MIAMADCLGDHKKCKNFKDACGDPVCMTAVNHLQQTEDITELGPQEVHDQDGVPLPLVEGKGCGSTFLNRLYLPEQCSGRYWAAWTTDC